MRPFFRPMLAALAFLPGFSESVTAQAQARPGDSRYWGPGVLPLSRQMVSLQVLDTDTPVFSEPSTEATRRGTAAPGAHLPIFGGQRGTGCSGRWFLVGPEAYVCGDHGAPSQTAAIPLDGAPPRTALGLSYRYFFVGPDGSFGYNSLSTAEDGVPETQLGAGFGVAVQQIAPKPAGELFGLTTHGFWLPMRDLLPAPSPSFRGSAWSATLGWITKEHAAVFSSPGTRRAGQTLERLTPVAILDSRQEGKTNYCRVADSTWVLERDVTRPQLVAAPAELRGGERWIDVDLKRQVLVAYAGEKPVFATLVSTGKGRRGSETATPVGSYRIWVKLQTSDMDNVDDPTARENYAIEAVPWVMFFDHGYGLHGTFWHQRFGEVRSHGCINLAPLDAEYLFHWTSPRLLPGWTAVLPTAREPGTLVHIHE